MECLLEVFWKKTNWCNNCWDANSSIRNWLSHYSAVQVAALPLLTGLTEPDCDFGTCWSTGALWICTLRFVNWVWLLRVCDDWHRVWSNYRLGTLRLSVRFFVKFAHCVAQLVGVRSLSVWGCVQNPLKEAMGMDRLWSHWIGAADTNTHTALQRLFQACMHKRLSQSISLRDHRLYPYSWVVLLMVGEHRKSYSVSCKSHLFLFHPKLCLFEAAKKDKLCINKRFCHNDVSFSLFDPDTFVCGEIYTWKKEFHNSSIICFDAICTSEVSSADQMDACVHICEAKVALRKRKKNRNTSE